MAKCVVCKAYNAQQEAAKHPNGMTLAALTSLLKKIKDRDPEAIRTFCDEHRNPLKLNTLLLDLFGPKNRLLVEAARLGVPLSAMTRFQQKEG